MSGGSAAVTPGSAVEKFDPSQDCACGAKWYIENPMARVSRWTRLHAEGCEVVADAV